MPEENNIMLDLETMDNRHTAAICAVGAVRFSFTAGGILSTFYEVVNFENAVETFGLTMNASTVKWWLRQSEEARSIFAESRETSFLPEMLTRFTSWIKNDRYPGEPTVWGNGAGFDQPIMENAYRAIRFPVPWKYWNNCCYRTMKNCYPNIPFQRVGTHHNALNDAESQALHLIKIYQSLHG